jgi:hypothetical protein
LPTCVYTPAASPTASPTVAPTMIPPRIEPTALPTCVQTPQPSSTDGKGDGGRTQPPGKGGVIMSDFGVGT